MNNRLKEFHKKIENTMEEVEDRNLKGNKHARWETFKIKTAEADLEDEGGRTKEEGCSTNGAGKKKKQVSSRLPMSRVLL